MTIRQDDTVLPLDGPPTVCAYNPSKTRVAITDGSRLMIRSTAGDALAASSSPLCDRDVSTSLVDTSALGAITSMCWIGDGQGHVIVCGTEKGVVMLYSEGKNERVGVSNAGYGMVGEMKRYSSSAVVCVERVDIRAGMCMPNPSSTALSAPPPAPSTLVAVGYRDGVVRVFECTGMDDGAALKLHSVIQCPVDGTGTQVACMASSSFSCPLPAPTAPNASAGDSRTLVLLVGYVKGSAPPPTIPESLLRAYHYNARHFCWEDVALGIDAGGVGPPGSQIAAIAWAPLSGRNEELIAVAVGPIVKLYGLRGALSDVRVAELGTLEHSAAVWQVKMNMTGTWLAASTDDNEVCMWRPDLAGDWVLQNKIVQASS
jgi:WD40 repeat protein